MPEPSPRTRVCKAVAGASFAFLAGLGVSGCSSSDNPSATPSSTPALPSVPLVVKLSKVTGKLPAARRSSLRADAGKVIGDWWQAAYLSTGSHDPFAQSFTPGAAKLAERDADLLSNARMHGISSIETKHREADLDVLAVKGRAKGVTAALHLIYTTTGTADWACAVRGTVSLTPSGSSWRIFGYDVTHTCHPRKAGS